MIRNRRSSVSVRFRRARRPSTRSPSPARARAVRRRDAYIRERLQSGKAALTPTPPPILGEGARRAGEGLTLMTLQRQLCSSPQAVAAPWGSWSSARPTRACRVPGLAQGIEQGRKVAAAQIILEQYPGKFLIFTDYLPPCTRCTPR